MPRAAGSTVVSLGIPATGAAIFTVASLAPWMQLVDAGYFGRFVAFAIVLALVVRAAGRLFARMTPRAAGAAPQAAIAAVVFGGVWSWNDVGPIDVVLFHVDSWRADHVSSYGYERETTPALDRFARDEAVLFRRFYSQSAGTDKSTPAMLAGIYPSMFYDPWTDDRNMRVPDRFPLLGQLLAEHGFSSFGISTNPNISTRNNYPRGFTRFEEYWEAPPRPEFVCDRVREHLEATVGHQFVFALVLDPHTPYEPGEGFNVFAADPDLTHGALVQRAMRAGEVAGSVDGFIDLYDGEILEVDTALGELLDWLRGEQRLERTMVIVTSDHGEKFNEYGEMSHGGTPYEAVIHIPLFWHFPSPLRFPPLRPEVRDRDELASQVELLPTILGFFGVDPPDHAWGANLIPELYGKSDPRDHDVFAEELFPGIAMRVLRSRTHKVMTRQTLEEERSAVLVDMRQPNEKAWVLGPNDESGVFEAMDAELRRRRDAAQAEYRPKVDPPPLGEAERLQLQHLGYG